MGNYGVALKALGNCEWGRNGVVVMGRSVSAYVNVERAEKCGGERKFVDRFQRAKSTASLRPRPREGRGHIVYSRLALRLCTIATEDRSVL